jgi:hypothetical protein
MAGPTYQPLVWHSNADTPLMIPASEPIHPALACMASCQPSSSLSHVGAERSLPVPSLVIQKTASGFIKRFKEIVKCLPENIPISSGNDKLAAFNIEPTLLDDPNINPDNLWEVVINGFLKEHLGWGCYNFDTKRVSTVK